MTKPTVRLHLYFAREAPRAVILRQGPTRQFRMILWHTDTDRFEDGQWLKQKVYTERCDLSPDGRHFLYFTLHGHWDSAVRGSYTVLCRPPWFTALALFPLGNTWSGGGRFLDNRFYLADGEKDIRGYVGEMERVRRVRPTPENATGIVRKDGSRAPLSRAVKARLLAGDEWVPPSDRYHVEGGRLYRREGGALELLRDFTDMEFEEIVAPWDDRAAARNGER